MLSREIESRELSRAVESIYSSPPSWARQDFGYWYHGTLVISMVDRRDRPLGEQWVIALRETLDAYADSAGAWFGNDRGTALVVKNAMVQMTWNALKAYYYR